VKRLWITYLIAIVALPLFALARGIPPAFVIATSFVGCVSTTIGMLIGGNQLKLFRVSERPLGLAQKILEVAVVSSFWLVLLLLMAFGKHGPSDLGYVIRENWPDVPVILVLMSVGLLVRELASKTKHPVALGLAAAIWSTTLFSYLASFYWNEGWWLD